MVPVFNVNKGFINSEILAAKRRKRKLEREWRKDNSAINRSRYRAAVNHFNRLVECAKTKHYSDMVRENEDNPKALWNSIKKVLHRSPKMVLPDYTTMNSLVNTFGRYFADKIAKLRSGLLSTDADPPVSSSYKNKFVSFRTMSEEEVPDHSILFNCLQHWYGIDGVVLKWVQSYLNSRKQRIKIDGHLSDAFQLPYGVPQGSVLGPLLFTLYTTPLSSVISKFNVTHHLYADDTQIYWELDSRNFDSSITELTNCLEAVQAWMGNNKA